MQGIGSSAKVPMRLTIGGKWVLAFATSLLLGVSSAAFVLLEKPVLPRELNLEIQPTHERPKVANFLDESATGYFGGLSSKTYFWSDTYSHAYLGVERINERVCFIKGEDLDEVLVLPTVLFTSESDWQTLSQGQVFQLLVFLLDVDGRWTRVAKIETESHGYAGNDHGFCWFKELKVPLREIRKGLGPYSGKVQLAVVARDVRPLRRFLRPLVSPVIELSLVSMPLDQFPINYRAHVLKVGMSKKDVIRILGEPPKSEAGTWKVKSLTSAKERWEYSETPGVPNPRIIVYFDSDGRFLSYGYSFC